MPIDELITPLTPSLNIMLGALAATLAARLQFWSTERTQKARLKVEKLERAYQLSQKIAEGYKREIINAKRHLPAHPDKYNEYRQHLGSEVSELKMVIRSYAPSLSACLQQVENGHKPLKEAFEEIDSQIAMGTPLTGIDFPALFQLWEGYLKLLNQGLVGIKRGIEEQLLALTKN
ncbi:hypothetical protein SRABI118_02448 [Massilia sp. Bi118]|uniref:hypothetical protein n=1 Tax=Massilia sp. Bi118 TaxID=2822346 RepID=UPI001D602A02|nr:hypothetical protein [Massilia sp. Bi118]CAH0230195.1 hypothetical protein SRABI118_02448 [Massilia sp. Bi118]